MFFVRSHRWIVGLILFLSVNHILCAADDDFDLPTGKPEQYKSQVSPSTSWDNQIYCTWIDESKFTVYNAVKKPSAKSGEDIVETKVLMYHNGTWQFANPTASNRATYVTECTSDGEGYIGSVTFKIPDGMPDYDSIFVVFVSFKANTKNKNYINNPDFELGDQGFESDYKKETDDTYVYEGDYTVHSRVDKYKMRTNNCKRDHTKGNGRGLYFQANGNSDKSKPNRVAWRQSIEGIAQCPSQYWAFSVYTQDWTGVGPGSLQWYIDDDPLGNSIDIDRKNCDWERFSVIWRNKGNKTNILLSLIDTSTRALGNDFGIDDLFFGCVDAEFSFHTVYLGKKEGSIDNFSLCPRVLEKDFGDIEAYIERNATNSNETLELSNPTSPEEAKQALLNGKEIYFDIIENSASLSLPEPWKTQGQCKMTNRQLIVTASTDHINEFYGTIHCRGTYTWAINGKTLTFDAPGDYFASDDDCENNRLHLKLQPPINHDTIVRMLKGETFTWRINNQTYSTPGNYYDTLKNQCGLDSIYAVLGIRIVDPCASDAHSFSINTDGDQVLISPGNLQYCAVPAPGVWRFAERQFDRCGNGRIDGEKTDNGTAATTVFWDDDGTLTPCNNELASSTYGGWVDHFCFGTSGLNDAHSPYSSIGQNFWSDWGQNVIGDDPANTWRTLTADEWNYLIVDRRVNGDYGFSEVCLKYGDESAERLWGRIIYPDDFSFAKAGVTPIAVGLHEGELFSYSSIEISAATWEALEKEGCVFLPTGKGNCGNYFWIDQCGAYWSSTIVITPASIDAKAMKLYPDYGYISSTMTAFVAESKVKHYVRLVRDFAGGESGSRVGSETIDTLRCGNTYIWDLGYTLREITQTVDEKEYTDTLKTECDEFISKLKLVLKPLTPQGNEITKKVWENTSYTWELEHQTYKIDAPGDYFDTLRTSQGCDSVISTLHLIWESTYTPPEHKYDTIYICQLPYTWHYNIDKGLSRELDAFDDYQQYLLDMHGYDSVILHLHLTFATLPPTPTDEFDTIYACDLPYKWTYDKKRSLTRELEDVGDSEETVQDMKGCDSVIIHLHLKLVVNNESQPEEACVKHLFTINENGKQVAFSSGNLQYKASTNTWRFAPNQYDIIGTDNSHISETYDGWIDLFGWGTSGYNSSNPWLSSNAVNYYGPEEGNFDVNSGDNRNYDWGYYNDIQNGNTTDPKGTWRTLTMDEWEYLFYTRRVDGGLGYSWVTIDYSSGTSNGLLLYPEDFSFSNAGVERITIGNNLSTKIDNDTWQKLDAAGCIFLPAAGYRIGDSDFRYINQNFGYWSANIGEEWYEADYMQGYFNFYNIFAIRPANTTRNYGMSVRLVKDVDSEPVIRKNKIDTIYRGESYEWELDDDRKIPITQTEDEKHYYDTVRSKITGCDSIVSRLTLLVKDKAEYEPCAPHPFTINANGGQVFISSGNLQYQASTDTWRFAERQFDRVANGWQAAMPSGSEQFEKVGWGLGTVYWDSAGYRVPCSNAFTSKTYGGWIDLFPWGTSGHGQKVDDKYACHFAPYDAIEDVVNETYNKYGYGPSYDPNNDGSAGVWGQGALSNNIDTNSGTNRYFDWGYANIIHEKDTAYKPGTWRTLTADEWAYLLNTRIVDNNDNAFSFVRIKYGSHPTDTVTGTLIYPDDFSFSKVSVAAIPFGARYALTEIDADTWATLEKAGVIFLPGAGMRGVYSATTNAVSMLQEDLYGIVVTYHSATAFNANYMKEVNFGFEGYQSISSTFRHGGNPVRLVRDLEVKRIDKQDTIQLTVKHLQHEFSVNTKGDKIFIAPGNLQYCPKKDEWRFAERQFDRCANGMQAVVPSGYKQTAEYGLTTVFWDSLEYIVPCNNLLISQTYGGWIDMFGWGTSGKGTDVSRSYPWLISTNKLAYGPNGKYDMDVNSEDNRSYDWGYLNEIHDHGEIHPAGTWRTPTSAEWEYLLTKRKVNDAAGYSFARIKYGDNSTDTVTGTILYPNDFTFEKAGIDNIPVGNTDLTEIEAEEWQKLEKVGCVFIPAARYRSFFNGKLDHETYDYGKYGYYWSSSADKSAYGSAEYAKSVRFEYMDRNITIKNTYRYNGLPVRLIKDAKNDTCGTYVWEVNNKTLVFHKAGHYYDTVRNMCGWDSVIAHLELIDSVIKPIVRDSIDTLFCGGSDYVWKVNDKTFTFDTEGDYYDTVRNVCDGDSVISHLKLVLKLNTIRKDTTDTIHCGNKYTWKLDDGRTKPITQTENEEMHYDTLIVGCDSIIRQLKLVIDPLEADERKTSGIIKQGEKYEWKITDDKTLYKDVEGIYRDTVRSVEGCDSIISILDLTFVDVPPCAQHYFSIGSDKKVLIAPGNLQYCPARNEWRFAERQYDRCGNGKTNGFSTTVYWDSADIQVPCNNLLGTKEYGGWIDIFDWGTGNDPCKNFDLPLEDRTWHEWGDNPINEGNITYPSGTWRTLTIEEWSYLLGDEDKGITGNFSWVVLQIDKDKNQSLWGVVIYPDDFSFSKAGVSSIPKGIIETPTVIDNATWTALEQAGCAFLPSACHRQHSTYPHEDINAHLHYWSSTLIGEGLKQAYCIEVGHTFDHYIDVGLPVRLVRDVDALKIIKDKNDTLRCGNDYTWVLDDGRTKPITQTEKEKAYYDTLIVGCDSIITHLKLVVEHTPPTPEYDTITTCQLPYTWTYDKKRNLTRKLEAVGDYDETVQDMQGCDSVILKLHLKLSESTTEYDTITTCYIPYTWTYDEENNLTRDLDDFGDYEETLKDRQGCDSVIIKLHLKLTPLITENETLSVCQFPYKWTYDKGRNLTRDLDAFGDYEELLEDMEGCDSVLVKLHLEQSDAEPTTETETLSVCQFPYTWTYDKKKNLTRDLDAFGDYEETLQDMQGCDSVIVKLHLKQSDADPTTETETLSVCQFPYTWTYDKKKNLTRDLDAFGDYEETLKDMKGCDSVIVKLHLKQSDAEPTTETETLSVCQFPYTWTYDKKKNLTRDLDAFGDYEETLKDMQGCDSVIVKLHLKQSDADPTPDFDTVAICGSGPYTWTYDKKKNLTRELATAGDHKETLQDMQGCDSAIMNLHLIFSDIVADVRPISATIERGETYEWKITDDKTLYKDTQGTHRDTVRSMYGCDSIISILQLTVTSIEPYDEPFYDTICNKNAYEWKREGQKLKDITQTTEKGTYRYTIPRKKNGKDSIYCILHLTRLETKTKSTNVRVCLGERYNWYTTDAKKPQSILVEGDYTNSQAVPFKHYSGCDSVIYTLNIIAKDCHTCVPLTKLELVPPKDVCADSVSFNYRFQYVAGQPNTYSVQLDARALADGFVNIEGQFEPDNIFDTYVLLPVNIPQIEPYIRPWSYEVLLNITDTCGVQHNFTDSLHIFYPSKIVGQHWNDVLAVLNSGYNGGYEFSAYQWYENEKPIYGAVKDIYYVPAKLALESKYQVLLTRSDDGHATFTCPVKVVSVEDKNLLNEPHIYVHPTMVTPENPEIQIQSNLDGSYWVYDMPGKLIRFGDFAAYSDKHGATRVSLPPIQSAYLIYLVPKDKANIRYRSYIVLVR